MSIGFVLASNLSRILDNLGACSAWIPFFDPVSKNSFSPLCENDFLSVLPGELDIETELVKEVLLQFCCNCLLLGFLMK